MSPEVSLNGKTFTSDMREISGFGGCYEAACRSMVLHGLKWLEDHPNEKPDVRAYNGIIGVDRDDNEAAEKLTAACLSATFTDEDGVQRTVREDCTGAMIQFSKVHAMKAHELGWGEYCRLMRENKDE